MAVFAGLTSLAFPDELFLEPSPVEDCFLLLRFGFLLLVSLGHKDVTVEDFLEWELGACEDEGQLR